MQGFHWKYNEYGAPPTRFTDILYKNSEAATSRQAVMLASGRFTKLTASSACVGFLTSDVASGTDQGCEVILAREGDVFEAPYTGTPDAGFVVGVNSANIAADGLSVDAANITGGPFAILEINTNKKMVRLKVKNRQLS